MTPTIIVATTALFFLVGFLFLLINLLVGWLLRPREPNPEKLDIYECGEPTIGSSFVQFDLRFYVVALLFLIFDVEVAFFFPWANVYGTAVQMMDSSVHSTEAVRDAAGTEIARTNQEAAFLYHRLGADPPERTIETSAGGSQTSGTTEAAKAALGEEVRNTGSLLAWIAMLDIAFFFAVLVVGFAYVWSKGDIDWVRATIGQVRHEAAHRTPAVALSESRGSVSVLSN